MRISMKQEVKDSLKTLGFSDYNVIIYETLLREKELDARQLSQKTKVPYSRVYEILNEMIEKEYIIKLDGRPSTYIPRSPIDVLQGIQKRRENEFMVNSQNVKDTLMNLYSEQRSAHNAQITITYGKATNLTHLKSLIKSAVKTFCLMLNDYDTFLPGIIDELKLLKLKNLKVNIILPKQHENTPEIAAIQEIGEFKFMENPPGNFMIADGENLIMMAAGDYLKNVSEDMIGVIMSHASTGFIIKQIFDNIWKS